MKVFDARFLSEKFFVGSHIQKINDAVFFNVTVFDGIVGILHIIVFHCFCSVKLRTLEREIRILHFAVAVLFRRRSGIINVIAVNVNSRVTVSRVSYLWYDCLNV